MDESMNNNEPNDYEDLASAIGGFIDNLKSENERLKFSLKKMGR